VVEAVEALLDSLDLSMTRSDPSVGPWGVGVRWWPMVSLSTRPGSGRGLDLRDVVSGADSDGPVDQGGSIARVTDQGDVVGTTP
jgi:hypothetical protein